MGWACVLALTAIGGPPALSAEPPRRTVVIAAPNDAPLFQEMAEIFEAHTDLRAVPIDDLELDRAVIEACTENAECLADAVRAAHLPEAVYLLSAGVEGEGELALALAKIESRGTTRLHGDDEDAYERALREVLDRDGHWEPYGAIAISTQHRGLRVEVDGERVGDTEAPLTVINNVLPGARSVRVSHDDSEYFGVVAVQRGEIAEVSADLVIRTGVLSGSGRSFAFWGSIGMFSAGLVTSAVSISSRDRVLDVCVTDGRVFCEDFSSIDRKDAWLSIGTGIASAGVVGAILSLMLDDESQATWMPPVLGAVVGAAVSTVLLLSENQTNPATFNDLR